MVFSSNRSPCFFCGRNLALQDGATSFLAHTVLFAQQAVAGPRWGQGATHTLPAAVSGNSPVGRPRAQNGSDSIRKGCHGKRRAVPLVNLCSKFLPAEAAPAFVKFSPLAPVVLECLSRPRLSKIQPILKATRQSLKKLDATSWRSTFWVAAS